MQKKPSDKSAYSGARSAKKADRAPALSPYEFEPIGIIRTGFAEKFGIPRQPGMVATAKGVIELRDHPFLSQACRTLETFSHIWIIFVFHDHGARDWKPSIRPPRLGGRKKVGVLSSRSPHRPNPIGLSAVKLESIDYSGKMAKIHVSGVDLLDGTPILDIKPYIPFADSIPDANAGWAAAPIEKFTVDFSPQSLESITRHEKTKPEIKNVIIEMLELDPRPASQKRKMPADAPESKGLKFAFTLFDVDVKWEIRGETFLVLDVEDLVNGKPREKTKPGRSLITANP